MFEKNGATLNLSTFPGKGVYSLPLVFGFMPKSAVTMMINKSWLDTLGLEVPQTLEELSDVLLAFYEGDPNGNGEADEIPLDWPSEAYVHAHDIFVLTGAYGVVDNQTDDMQVVKDGVVSFLYVEDAYYKIIQYLHDLYSNNLINPEVFTNDYSAAGVLSAQGEIARVGVTTGWSPASRVGQYADQYIVLDQLKVSADSEITPLWPSNPAQLNVFPNVCELTIACEEPEAAMRLINHMYSYDFTIQDYYGSFPDNTIKYDDGTYEILVPEDGTTIEQNKWENALVNYGPGFFSDELESMTKAPGEILGRVEIDKVYDDNRPELVNIFPIVKYDAETSEELIYLKTDIKKLVVQKMAEWVVNGGIEEEWENYLSDLDKMGLPRMQEIYQKAYDENHY
jgi:putative aldouronate transport system substrate-binding protein